MATSCEALGMTCVRGEGCVRNESWVRTNGLSKEMADCGM